MHFKTVHVTFFSDKERPITVKEVFSLLKGKSSEWDKIGRELEVSDNFREELRNQSLTDESRLEKVLAKWVESECSEVSWDHLQRVLKELGYVHLVKKMPGYHKSCPKANTVHSTPLTTSCSSSHCLIIFAVLIVFFAILYYHVY